MISERRRKVYTLIRYDRKGRQLGEPIQYGNLKTLIFGDGETIQPLIEAGKKELNALYFKIVKRLAETNRYNTVDYKITRSFLIVADRK